MRFRTHWATSRSGIAKFAVYGLQQCESVASDCAAEVDEDAEPDRLGLVPIRALRDGIGAVIATPDSSIDGGEIRERYYRDLHLWTDRNAQADAITRIRGLHAAGWDLGAEPLSVYAELLDQYVMACRDARWEAHELLARAHRACLRTRYNL